MWNGFELRLCAFGLVIFFFDMECVSCTKVEPHALGVKVGSLLILVICKESCCNGSSLKIMTSFQICSEKPR